MQPPTSCQPQNRPRLFSSANFFAPHHPTNCSCVRATHPTHTRTQSQRLFATTPRSTDLRDDWWRGGRRQRVSIHRCDKQRPDFFVACGNTGFPNFSLRRVSIYERVPSRWTKRKMEEQPFQRFINISFVGCLLVGVCAFHRVE